MDLSRITVFCFFASYSVALALESIGMLGRRGGRLGVALAGGRRATLLGFTAAGLFAHLAYLAWQSSSETTPLASPAEWCLLAAALLAAVYLATSVANAKLAAGVFLLPVVLALVGIAQFASDQPFATERVSFFWGQAHGWLLVATAVSVCVGFVAGLMYLIQSWRLKHKRPPSLGWSLPSLESLESVNAWSLRLSVWLMAGGFLSGVLLTKLNQSGGDLRLWTHPVVIASAVLFQWLLIAIIFQWVYPPARTGRKVAYMTVTAFVFLALMVASVVIGGPEHGTPRAPGDVALASRHEGAL